MKGIILISTILLLLVALSSSEEVEEAPKSTHRRPQSSTSKILRSHGYLAEDHYVSVQGGKYLLNLVKATNPLINHPHGRSANLSEHATLPLKKPHLFVHGLLSNANIFLASTGNEKVRPQNYRSYNLADMKMEELETLLEYDPGAKSLVYTLLNFGHEVWLLNRRSTRDSRRAQMSLLSSPAPLKTESDIQILSDVEVPQHYWNYSLDEQAYYDYPKVVKYVLEHSGRKKLVSVSYGIGSTITMMALIEKPLLASSIAKAILWAPIFDVPRGSVSYLTNLNVDGLSGTLGHYPTKELKTSYSRQCSKYPQACNQIIEHVFGSGLDQITHTNKNFDQPWLDFSSNFEAAQIGQSEQWGAMHHYDYKDLEMNNNAYHHFEPPIYNISRLSHDGLTFWVGNTDPLVDVNRLFNRLSPPVKGNFHVICRTGCRFNHLAFIWHQNIVNQLIIPTLQISSLRG